MPKVTNYSRGYAAEMRMVHKLRDAGYYAIRTAGSHSSVDIIAANGQHVIFLQVKRQKNGPPRNYVGALWELKALHTPPCVEKRVALWIDEEERWYEISDVPQTKNGDAELRATRHDK